MVVCKEEDCDRSQQQEKRVRSTNAQKQCRYRNYVKQNVKKSFNIHGGQGTN